MLTMNTSSSSIKGARRDLEARGHPAHLPKEKHSGPGGLGLPRKPFWGFFQKRIFFVKIMSEISLLLRGKGTPLPRKRFWRFCHKKLYISQITSLPIGILADEFPEEERTRICSTEPAAAHRHLLLRGKGTPLPRMRFWRFCHKKTLYFPKKTSLPIGILADGCREFPDRSAFWPTDRDDFRRDARRDGRSVDQSMGLCDGTGVRSTNRMGLEL